MSDFEELSAQFEVLNVEKVEPTILQKCEDLCRTYNISPEDFVDQWLAYSASNSLGLAPTLSALDRLERYELKKLSKSSITKTPQTPRHVTVATPMRTPVRQNLQEEMMECSSPVQKHEEISHTVPSQEFVKRSDAGSIVQSFGACKDGFEQRASKVVIKTLNEVTKTGYMYERLLARRAALNEMSRWVIKDIVEHYNLQLSEEKLKQYSGEMVICGRIFSDTQERINSNSILLDGFVDLYKGQIVRLSVNKLEKIRLYPGQTVVVSGNNMKDWFTVKEAFVGAPLPPPKSPENFTETLQIIVAAGPFTFQDNLLHEPLEELLKHVSESKPNILILMGPFLDKTHPHLQEFTTNYEKYFESIVDGIMHRLQDTGVEVVLVPSHKDIHNHVIFPTLPYSLKKRHDNLHLAPNPFILDINGVVISGSTADILFHINKTEFSKGSQEDRIGQIVSHVFNQRCFYPLHPPDVDIRVDYQFLEQFGMLEYSPHLMILPSNFKHFVKPVGDCIVVNPERLAKGNGGTFAKIEVRPTPKDKKVCERISCLIQRV